MVGSGYRLAYRLYPYRKAPDQDGVAAHHPVVVIGGGPVGLVTALDLGLKGTPVLVLDDHEGAGQGSRAICFSKRTLDIAARLGASRDMVREGVLWEVGRVFHGDRTVFEFNLLPEEGHRNPAFINLQQPRFERLLVDAVRRAQADGAPIKIRGLNRVVGVSDTGDRVRLDVETPDGPYHLTADYVVACDGARSPTREMLGLPFEGRVFEDNFLIADVRMKAAFPPERWFWFDPPFEHSGKSALLHKQPDDIWRIDFQLGKDIDRALELDPRRIRRRVDAMLSRQSGSVPDYDLEWTSIYTFQCRRMARFRHGRILFAGDAAHQVSPFGARGANSGIQDADNLAWKLDLVIRGLAPDRLLDTYGTEREAAADENILNSTRSTDFLTPRNRASEIYRSAVLELAARHAFARPLVNSGRLSLPFVYDGFPGFGPDALPGAPAETRPGCPCTDAPLTQGYLLDLLPPGFVLLAIGGHAPDVTDVSGIKVARVELDPERDSRGGLLAERYLGSACAGVYLIRPDQHVVARWADPRIADVTAALARAAGLETTQ